MFTIKKKQIQVMLLINIIITGFTVSAGSGTPPSTPRTNTPLTDLQSPTTSPAINTHRDLRTPSPVRALPGTPDVVERTPNSMGRLFKSLRDFLPESGEHPQIIDQEEIRRLAFNVITLYQMKHQLLRMKRVQAQHAHVLFDQYIYSKSFLKIRNAAPDALVSQVLAMVSDNQYPLILDMILAGHTASLGNMQVFTQLLGNAEPLAPRNREVFTQKIDEKLTNLDKILNEFQDDEFTGAMIRGMLMNTNRADKIAVLQALLDYVGPHSAYNGELGKITRDAQPVIAQHLAYQQRLNRQETSSSSADPLGSMHANNPSTDQSTGK